MAGLGTTYYRNYSSTDNTSMVFTIKNNYDFIAKTIDEVGWSAPEGYRFKEWNVNRDGSGYSFQPGDECNNEIIFAIWEEISQSVEYLTTDQSLTAVADAIRAKGGTSAPLVYPTGFVSAIQAIPTGGGSGGGSSTDDVVFYDYDGSVVASYSASDFANLSAMPENPTHTGLTSQGWNWSLANAKAYVAKYGKLNIGQMYITDDGKTRVYIHLEEGRTSPMLGVCPNGTVDVDWGDGSTHDTLTGTSTTTPNWTPIHHYASPGDYVIKLTVTGSIGFYGTGNALQASGLLRYSESSDTRNYVYRNAITKVEIGSGVSDLMNFTFNYCYSLSSVTIPDSVTSIGYFAFNFCHSLSSVTVPYGVTSIKYDVFYKCYSLSSITIPDSVTSIGYDTFRDCSSLSSVTIPDSVRSIANNMFSGCYSLSSVTIQDSVTSIGNSAFANCYSLSSVTVPDSVTSIGANAFNYCYGINEYHFLKTTPPTLANTNVFANISADCIIYVPAASLDAYKTATNWSTYASYMQGE